MSPKSFKTLLALSLSMTLLAVMVHFASTDHTGEALGTEVALNDLASRVNEVGLISITTAENTITLTREDDGAWLVEERDGYPANTHKVQETVLALSRLVLHEKKTANPARYHRLGLESGTQVFITTDDGTTLVDATTGKRVAAQSGLPGGGVYVRLGDDTHTWLAAGPLDLGTDLKDWIETSFIDVAAERIASVILYHGNGDTVMLERVADQIALLGMPEDYKVDNEYRLNSIPAFLEDLNVDDVRATETPGPIVVTSAFETSDGLRVDMDLIGDEDVGYWLRFDASGQTPETHDEANLITARTHGWLFRIADWKSTALRHRMDDLIAPIVVKETQ